MTRKNRSRILKASFVCGGFGALSAIATLAVGLPLKFNGQNLQNQILAQSEYDAESQKYVITQVEEYEHAKQMEYVGSEILTWCSFTGSYMALACSVLTTVWGSANDEEDKNNNRKKKKEKTKSEGGDYISFTPNDDYRGGMYCD